MTLIVWAVLAGLCSLYIMYRNCKKEKKQIRRVKPLKVKSFWDPKKKIGVCGDWFVGPRLESGWISAQDLFKKISR